MDKCELVEFHLGAAEDDTPAMPASHDCPDPEPDRPRAGAPTRPRLPATIRGESEVRATFSAASGRTRIAELYEQGSLRLRCPRSPAGCEAVLINTGGGIIGGDRIGIDLALGASAHVIATTQAAEKVYRAQAEPARIGLRANVGEGARLDWLPQETILFGHAAVERRLDIEMAASASLTLLEVLVLGRIARGERIVEGRWRDRWRITRAGRLVLAEEVRLEGAIAALMQRPALGAGARAIATLVHIAPGAEERLETVRERLGAARSDCAASAWDGMLVARFASPDPRHIRADAVAAATALTGAPMPRAWAC